MAISYEQQIRRSQMLNGWAMVINPKSPLALDPSNYTSNLDIKEFYQSFMNRFQKQTMYVTLKNNKFIISFFLK